MPKQTGNASALSTGRVRQNGSAALREGRGAGAEARAAELDLTADLLRISLEPLGLDKFFSRLGDLLLPTLTPLNVGLFIRDRLTGKLINRVWSDRSQPCPGPDAADHGYAGVVLRTAKPLFIYDADKEFHADGFEKGDVDCSAWAGVPLNSAARTFGVLAVHDNDGSGAIKEIDPGSLSAVGDKVAVAIERKFAEEALIESESRYRMLFDHAPDGIIIAAEDGRIIDANRNMYQMLGYEHADFVRLAPEEIVEPRFVARIGSALAQIAESSHHQEEWKFLHRDGTTVPVEVSATKMPDHRVLAIVRDLTERRRAEAEKAQLAAEVARQRERLKNIVANLPGIVWEASFLPGKNLSIGNFVSNYVERMLGYSVEQWLSTPDFWLSIVREDYAAKLKNILVTMRPDANVVQLIPLTAKDGRTVWVESHSAAFADESGRVIGVRGVMIDITDRKRSEEALINSEERYRELVENAIDIIYTHDLEGNYKSINRAVERITGYTREEVLRMNMQQTIAPECIDKAREMTAAKLAGQDVTAYELDITGKDGRRVSLEVNTKLVLDKGRPVAVQGIARDITQRKLLEEKYRQSQKLEAVGLLAGGISHDFNNLLTAMNGYSELTLNKMSPDDPLRQNIEEIRSICGRAAALTRQLLAFSRKQMLKPEVHNLNSVISGMEKMLRRLVRENIEIEIDLQPHIHNIEADPTQLEQVILNLVVNAQDAMPDGGRLAISTENITYPDESRRDSPPGPSSEFVKMTVADTGEGIDDAVRERIFEPFFTTKDTSKGSGLGLSTVHGIVKQSGGEIVVRSAKGEGTVFEVLLPAASKAQDDPHQVNETRPPKSGVETLLLVEDDDPVRRLIEEILTDLGYKVLSASGPREALERCEAATGGIDLLLTDLVMPGMSGIELISRVSAMRPGTRTIVMSGYVPDGASVESLRSSSATFIQKPFTPDELSCAVRQALDQNLVRSEI